jgi:DNA-binding CsgD family transcriptional regulator
MERLSNKDVQALLEFIREGYRSRDVTTLLHRVNSRLATVVQLKNRRYHEVGPPPTAKANVGQAHKDGDFSKPDSLYCLKVRSVNDQENGNSSPNHPHPAASHNFAGLRPQRIPFGALRALLRARGKHISKNDRVLVNLLRSHLFQAYRNAEKATRIERKVSIVEGALGGLHLGLMVLTMEGEIRLATRHAVQQLRLFLPDKALRANRLPSTILTWIKQQQLASSRENAGSISASPIVLEQQGKRLVIRFVPNLNQILLLVEEQPIAAHTNAVASSRLSVRESQVLDWLAQGKTNKEIAAILQLSPRTVQKHLEHIYQKLGVENRTGAAAKAYQLRPSDLEARSSDARRT